MVDGIYHPFLVAQTLQWMVGNLEDEKKIGARSVARTPIQKQDKQNEKLAAMVKTEVHTVRFGNFLSLVRLEDVANQRDRTRLHEVMVTQTVSGQGVRQVGRLSFLNSEPIQSGLTDFQKPSPMQQNFCCLKQ